MFNGATNYSLADIAAAAGGNRSGDMLGDGNGWWIILLFLLTGGNWGNNFGGGRNGGGSIREEISYGFDMNGLENSVRGIQQGLCDGFYAQNTALLNGFNGVQSSLCQGFNGVNTALLQGFCGIQAQMANDALADQKCCCETQNLINSNFANLNYNIATQGCDTRRAIADSTRDIIDAQNAGTRQVLDFLVQDKLATLQSENQALKFAASQANQNVTLGAMIDASTAEILRRTAPIPVPAYPAPQYGCWSPCNTGCNTGCNNFCF